MTNYEKIKTAIAELDSMPIMTQYLSKGAANSDSEDDFACIGCGSGTGEKGTGAMHNYDDHCYCYSCNGKFKNHDIAAYLAGLPLKTAYFGEEFHRYAEKIFEMLGKSYDYAPPTNFSSSSNNSNSRVALPVESLKEQEQPPKSYSKFYKYARSQLPKFISSQGGNYRGLTLDDWQAVGAGFTDNFKGSKCLILPYDNHTFFARSVHGEAKTIKRKNAGGKVQIYNPYKVFSSSEIIFIVEGEIDAITIHKCGYAAIATGGAGQFSKILAQIDTAFAGATKKPLFIVMFDNNDKGTGQNGAAKLVEGLQQKGFMAVNVILSYDNQYDANEFLEVNRAGLETRLAEIYSSAMKDIEKLKEEAILAEEQDNAEIYGTGFSYFFKRKFYKSLEKGVKFAELDTGFKNLNDAQIFGSGLYVIGAPPSAGKTSFIWQLLEQMARQDSTYKKNHCIFCSYELSEEHLYSKSLARAFHDKESDHFEKEIKYPLSSAIIRQKGLVKNDDDFYYFNRFAESLELVEDFQNADFDLRVLDFSNGNRPNINKLIERLKKIVTEIPERDRIIIGVDYLQLIPPADIKMDIRQAIDDTLHKLKDFCNKYNVLIFLISSYNRNAYKNNADFSAFKESGTIEYHADCLWCLQLFVGRKERDSESLSNAKKQTPRPMELVTLKNRNGNDYRLFFKYFSAVDTFFECEESDFEE